MTTLLCVDLSDEALAAIGTCPKCRACWLADPMAECECTRPGVPPEAAEAAAGAKAGGQS